MLFGVCVLIKIMKDHASNPVALICFSLYAFNCSMSVGIEQKIIAQSSFNACSNYLSCEFEFARTTGMILPSVCMEMDFANSFASFSVSSYNDVLSEISTVYPFADFSLFNASFASSMHFWTISEFSSI